MANDYYTKKHAGVEGLRSESDPDWNWEQRNEELQRSGPSAAVRAKIKELTRTFGPPPDDLQMYGTFDVEDYGGIQAHDESLVEGENADNVT